MHGQVNKHTTLLDRSEVKALFFEFPFLFAPKIVGPNLVKLEFEPIDQHVIEVTIIIHCVNLMFKSVSMTLAVAVTVAVTMSLAMIFFLNIFGFRIKITRVIATRFKIILVFELILIF